MIRRILIGVGIAVCAAISISFWRASHTRSPSERELVAAVAKAPAESEPHQRLAEYLYRTAWFSRDPAPEKLKQHQAAYREFTVALELCQNEIDRCWLLPGVAWAAFHAHDFAGARRIAREIVSRATPPVKHPWEDCNRGNSLHAGHLILGRVALREGDLAGAKRELLAAGRTPGSPQLNSFGPNMSLAKELLERGERDVVLEYFTLCGKFWSLTFGKLGHWSRQVKRGDIPDFGANLVY